MKKVMIITCLALGACAPGASQNALLGFSGGLGGGAGVVSPASYSAPGIPVYSASQCTGPVIMGNCHGNIIPNGVASRCYGEMLNGYCTGPMF